MAFKHSQQYELWADLSHQNTHLRRNNWLHWFVHVALVVTLVLSFSRPLMAIRVDSLGTPELLQSVTAYNTPRPEEAEHVSRLMAQYLLEVTSGSVQRDLTKALSLMTADFQRAYQEKVKEDTSLALLEKGNVRTVLALDGKGTEVRAEKDSDGRVTRYFVRLVGRIEVYRADVFTEPLLVRSVVIRSTLLAVPRTTHTLNGLLVEFFDKEYVDPASRGGTGSAPLPSVSPLKAKDAP